MLTDKQIENIALKYTRDRDVIAFARAIEKAVLKEKANLYNKYLVNEEAIWQNFRRGAR
jgi:hypothetical protein